MALRESKQDWKKSLQAAFLSDPQGCFLALDDVFGGFPAYSKCLPAVGVMHTPTTGLQLAKTPPMIKPARKPKKGQVNLSTTEDMTELPPWESDLEMLIGVGRGAGDAEPQDLSNAVSCGHGEEGDENKVGKAEQDLIMKAALKDFGDMMQSMNYDSGDE